MDDFERVVSALASPGQPDATMRALDDLAAKLVGHRVLTLMAVDRTSRLASRVYSSHPEAYPVSGSKPLEANEWSAAVLNRHETWVMNSIDHIAQVFPDHALIASLGCASSLNLPIVVGGQVPGTINFLHEAGYYTPERVAAAKALRLPGATAFLLAASLQTTKEKP